jgi:hypothetical protein
VKSDHVTRLLEIGLGLCGAALLGGFAALVFGRLGGHAQWRAGDAEARPKAGSVPPDRHEQISSASPR